MSYLHSFIRTPVLLAALLCAVGCAPTSGITRSPEAQVYVDSSLAQPLPFRATAQQVPAIWSRAQSVVAQLSRLPLHAVTEYVIETERPDSSRRFDRWFRITRSISGEAFSVNVDTRLGALISSPASQYDSTIAHVVAYYIATGREMPPVLIKELSH